MPRKLGPQDPTFYDAPSQEMMMRLPGKLVITPEDLAVLGEVHGFSDLVRGKMRDAFERRDRQPGDICVTAVRGFPQLNIVGLMKDAPQLVWLQGLVTPDGKDISGNALVRNFAEGLGKDEARDVKKKGGTLRFAEEVIDGRNVTDPTSPIRILPNDAHPNPQVQYIAPDLTAIPPPPDNDVGTAAVTTNVVDNVDSNEQMRHAIEREALRLESAIAPKIKDLPASGPQRLLALVQYLLKPANLLWVLKLSPVMKLLINRTMRNGTNGKH